jgi:putative transposase
MVNRVYLLLRSVASTTSVTQPITSGRASIQVFRPVNSNASRTSVGAIAVLRIRSKDSVIIHSDQGSQFGSDDFIRSCKDNRLSPSMSRRYNCCDNAVAESFFRNLKSEQIKKWIYQNRTDAKSDIFDYIEGFYNRVRRHKHLDQLSPLEFDRQRQTAL